MPPSQSSSEIHISLSLKRQADYDRAKRMEDSLQSFLIIDFSTPLRSARNDIVQYLTTVPLLSSIFMFNNLLEFVLHVADDLSVEKVDDALSTGCVLL